MRIITAFILALAVLFVNGCATVQTDIDPAQEVVEVEGTDKDVLYVRANNWMVDAFQNADSVIQFTDKDSGTITGRYLLGTISEATQYGPASYAYATIRVQVRDNAARITVEPESFSYAKGNIYTLYTEEDALQDMDRLVTSFREAIKEPDEEW